LEPLLPGFVEPRWYAGLEAAVAQAPGVEVAWYDGLPGFTSAIEAATDLRWLSTVSAGVELFPHGLLRARGIRLTNGSGLNAAPVADYAVMSILAAAKGFPDVVRAHDRGEWLGTPPSVLELEDTQALIVGYGAIGVAVAKRLATFGVKVTGVRSRPYPSEGILGPDDWLGRLGEFDWIVLAAPATSRTSHLISAPELASMKPTAWLFNVARGALIANDALLEALTARRIGGAFLDVTDPEPLPPGDPLWSAPNAIITMHLAGRSQRGLTRRGATLFVDNLRLYARGDPLRNTIDLVAAA